MKLFDELDSIVAKAIREVMEDERMLQQRQSKAVDKLGLRASDNNVEEVEEAEGDDEPKEDEESKKLKGATKPKAAKAATSKGEKPDDEVAGTATSKKMKDPSKGQIKKPSFKSIANNINLLRGGKSLKDPGVKKNLQDYVDKLEVDERRQVLVYLNSLAQIMSGIKSGAAAADPEQAERQVDKKEKPVKKETPAPKKKDSGVIVVGGE